jgi:uncharacterized protein (DUF2062 family)
MPRRIFKKFALKKHIVAGQWFMTPFRHMLHDPRLWGAQRRWIVPAFALGLFVAFLPFPGHTLMAALLALALRVNIPVAAISTWVSNPATMGPMYYLAYEVGSWLLNMEGKDIGFEVSFDWVTQTFVTVWQPMLLGCILLGSAAALLGYTVLNLLWRWSIVKYKIRKRGNRRKSA